LPKKALYFECRINKNAFCDFVHWVMKISHPIAREKRERKRKKPKRNEEEKQRNKSEQDSPKKGKILNFIMTCSFT